MATHGAEQLLGDGGVLLHRAGGVDEHEIGARIAVGVAAGERVLEPGHLERIRPRDDQRLVRASRGNGGADLDHHLGSRDHLLALHVAAALRRDLILDLNRVGADGLELADREPDARLGAVARVGIDDDRQIGRGAHAAHALDDLRPADQPDVGQAEVVRGRRVAAVVERLDAGPLRDPRGETVVRTEGDDGTRLGEARAKAGRHADPPVGAWPKSKGSMGPRSALSRARSASVAASSTALPSMTTP